MRTRCHAFDVRRCGPAAAGLAILLAAPGLALDVVKNGSGVTTIVVPKECDKQTAKAAGWLREYVARATGASLPVVNEPQAPAGALIAVGHTQMAQQAGVDCQSLKWDGCRLVVKGRVLFLLGRDQPPQGHLGAHGTGRAVVTFLEDTLGVRWFLPGRMGVRVPQTKDVAVPDDLDRTVNPAFAYCHGRYLYGMGTPGSIANNFRTAVKVQSYGGHSYYGWVPEKKYSSAHPEYFALRRSARTAIGNHLCSSNPEVKRILLREIRKAFDKGYDWVQLGQEDGYKRCECPECEKLDRFRGRAALGHQPKEDYIFTTLKENPCERLLLLHKWIADRCRESHPAKTVHLLVYGPTLMPSKRFDRFGDTVVAELCSEDPRVIALWHDKVRALTEYVYWWYPLKGIQPMVTPAQVAEHVRHLRDNNVIGIYQASDINWGLEGPNYYALGRLLRDPDLDPRGLLDEYCRGVYPEVAERMKGFFSLLYSRVQHLEELDPFLRTLGGSIQETRFLVLYPPELVEQLDRMLTLAEEHARGAHTQGWLRHTRDHFDYLKLVSHMFVSYRAYQASPDAENLFELKRRVDEFEQWRARILAYDRRYRATWFPGYNVTERFLTHKGGAIDYYTQRPRAEVAAGVRGEAIGFGRCGIRAPLTWDFDRMAKRLGQGRERRSLVVKRTARPPKIDGRLAADEWQAAATAELGTVGGGGVSSARTRVRLLYDERNLYVAWECEEPKIDQLQVKSVGRDGAVYSLDCVELLLDPTASLDSYKHFMAAAIGNARYDARVDHVLADPHKSSHSPEDKSYDPEWEYGFHVDREAKRWTIEMKLPFASLQADPPKSGTKWLGNFGRERYVGDRGAGLYLWSPSHTGSFRDVFAFGALYFDRPPETLRPGSRAAQATAPAAEAALLGNGSFEECIEAQPDLPEGWELKAYPGGVPLAPVLEGCALSRQKAIHGKVSLKVDPQAMGLALLKPHENCHALWGQDLSHLAPKLRGKKVRLSAWIYYDCVSSMSHPNPFFVLRATGPKGLIRENVPTINATPQFFASVGYGAHSDRIGRWIKLESEGAIPPETTRMDLHCGMRVKVGGKTNPTCLYVDDVRLELIED